MRASFRTVLVVASLVTSGLAVTPAGAAAPDRPVISIGDFRPTVSPNRDGYHDRLRLPVTISHLSWVDMRLRNLTTGHVVRRGRLVVDGSSTVRRGTHVLGLRELRNWQHTLTPGTYRLRLTADPLDPGPRSRPVSTTFRILTGPIQLDGRAEAPTISPNGDGSGDRTRIGYTLERRSRVTALVTAPDGRTVVTRFPLGVRGKGHHGWRWNGREQNRARRAALADGPYTLTLRARPVVGTPRRAGVAQVLAIVDTAPPEAAVRLNRTTVYPSATLIADSLRVGVMLPPEEIRSAEIRSSRGAVVARLSAQGHECEWGDDYFDGECTLLTWSGRSGTGPVPAGAYVLRLTLVDAAGNTTPVRRAVSVSTAQLVERTASVTWAGGSAPQASDFCIANYCTEAEPCPPHASERFPGGVSFRANPEECRLTYGSSSARDYGFTPELPAGSTPHDRFRLTVVGGPTTPGDDDTGWLEVGPATTTLSGDQTTVSPWTPVRPDVELFAETDRRARWTAGATKPARYDAATYTLEYTYYVPAT